MKESNNPILYRNNNNHDNNNKGNNDNANDKIQNSDNEDDHNYDEFIRMIERITFTRKTETPRIPKQPFGTKFLDLLLFFSPRYIYGYILSMKKNPFVQINFDSLTTGLIGILLPLLVIRLINQIAYMHMNSVQHNGERIIPPTSLPRSLQSSSSVSSSLSILPILDIPLAVLMFSPWYIHCTMDVIFPTMQIIKSIFSCIRNRAAPLQDAIETLQQQIHDGRAIRKRRYDIYLPQTLALSTLPLNKEHEQQSQPNFFRQQRGVNPTHSFTNKNNNNNNHHDKNIFQIKDKNQYPYHFDGNYDYNVIMLFSGAYVSHLAYAEVAKQLSDYGLIVVVPSFEPLRLALANGLGADHKSIQQLMNTVEQNIQRIVSHQIKKADKKAIVSVQQQQQQKQKQKQKLSTLESIKINRNINIDSKYDTTTADDHCSTDINIQWSLMGHSLGSFTAMELCNKFEQEKEEEQVMNNNDVKNSKTGPHDSSKKRNINRLIMWGSMYEPTYASDLSNSTMPILLIQGSNDPLLQLTKNNQKEFFNNFPRIYTISYHRYDEKYRFSYNTKNSNIVHHIMSFLSRRNATMNRDEQSLLIKSNDHHPHEQQQQKQKKQNFQLKFIKGGTHGGFATYFSQIDNNNNNDSISNTKQQCIACMLTAKFILDK